MLVNFLAFNVGGQKGLVGLTQGSKGKSVAKCVHGDTQAWREDTQRWEVYLLACVQVGIYVRCIYLKDVHMYGVYIYIC